jgi:non-heme chloroperoxidase
MTTFRSRHLSVGAGVELDVIESGDPGGLPLLLLHGLSDSNRSMKPMMAELPPSIRAIAVTQRGHGDSAKPLGPYTTAAFVADAAMALDQLGVRRAVVLGHSMGSVVAQHLALGHPARVQGLVLVGAFPGLKDNPAVEAFYDAEVKDMTDPIDPAFARAFQASTIARPLPPEFFEMVVGESQKLPAHAWKAIFRDMLQDATDAGLPRITAHTVLLWGDQDSFVSRSDQDRLLAIPGSRLEVFEGTGHDPQWEEPARAARIVAEHVRRCFAPVPA